MHPRDRHAEIAGAGLAGVTAAALLAQRGWSVRVHERGSELREIGAGIFMWENGLRVLEEIGAFDEATRRAELIQNWRLFDERRRLIQGAWMKDSTVRLYTVLRTDLHRALVNAAESAGVQFVTGSEVVSASRDGQLTTISGQRWRGDLVIGADGVNSKVRDTLGLRESVTDLHDGCGRHLIARRATDPVEQTLEYWNGARRVGIVPCAPDQVYVYLCCPEDDLAGRAKPLDKRSWIGSFPHLADVIDRIDDVGRWASFSDSVSTSWRVGHGCILGDAAHAMSPNLGQGACVAMANARSLAHALDAGYDIPRALEIWERSERPTTDRTQRYSRIYGRVGTSWPRPLLSVRSALFFAAGRSRRWQRHVNVAAVRESPLVR
jgi:2-polyprenyl-6-methoxyphenol hydroxylase-like FAD-dependent oxidoreductase